MAKGTPMLPNGKRDNMKANQPSKPTQAPMDVKAKKKATNAHEDARSPKPATKAPAKPAPKNAEQAKDQAFHLRMAQLDAKGTLGNKNANKPRPAPKGGSAESGMGGKVAKGSKNPLRKLVSRVKRGR